MIYVQNGRGPQEMGKERRCRTGNLFMSSPPYGRDRLGTVLLFDPTESFGHEAQGFIPRYALPFSFSSLTLSFQGVEKPVRMVDLFMGVYGLCAFDVHGIGNGLNLAILDGDKHAALHMAVLTKGLDNAVSHLPPVRKTYFFRE
jgi:hypothetical protein